MIEPQLRAEASTWLREGRAAVVVSVASAQGSAPRHAGTRMLVAADDTAGTIGGGHLELKAVTIARAMLLNASRGKSAQSAEARTPMPAGSHTESFALGPSLGQCCGGAVTLAFDALDDAALANWPLPAPHFHLQLHGAGHVGRAIATLLSTLDVVVDWFDEREEGFAPANSLGAPWPAHIRRVGACGVEAEVQHAPAGAFYLVLTHEHALDLRIVEAVLKRADARADVGFAGLIGSKTKRTSFEHRLAERGVSARAMARLACPIGIDGIDGREPEVIALAVVAELMRVAGARRAAAAEHELDHVKRYS